MEGQKLSLLAGADSYNHPKYPHPTLTSKLYSSNYLKIYYRDSAKRAEIIEWTLITLAPHAHAIGSANFVVTDIIALYTILVAVK
jgi:hypothetical protein